MTARDRELRDIVRQLRQELAWAERIGYVVEQRAAQAPAVRVEAEAPVAREAPAQRPAPSFDRAPPPPDRAPPPSFGRAPPPSFDRAPPPSFDRAPPPRGGAPTPSTRPGPAPAPPAARPGLPVVQAAPPPNLEGPMSLDEIRAELGDCTRCKLHKAGRKQIVFGVGNPKAELMFIGEGPGAQEDQEGVPFVGEAGQLLTKIIEAMGFRRDEVYIANIVKCRPPNNRDPEPDEVLSCEPFLKKQIETVGPQLVVTLGKYASQTLLRTTTPITRLRGNWGTYAGIPVMPTFHPAYLLRSPHEKRPVWQDMQAVVARMGRALPPSRG